MVMNLILVFLVCECNEYVIPKSISRKDLGYKCNELGETETCSNGSNEVIIGLQNDDVVKNMTHMLMI
jgi:hypothetical protein